MAWIPTLMGLPLLLLPLLPLFWASTRAGDREMVLLALPEVNGSLGDTVNLTCILQPVESEIPRVTLFISAGKDPDLLDASLTLTELRPDDNTNYTCEVTTLLHGSWRANTWVRVFYAPQVSISLYDDINQWGHRETSLSCEARGNPKPKSYNWSTTTGSLPPYAVPQGARLLLQPSGESINTTFICRVSNALGTIQIPMRVQLPGTFKEQSQSRSHWLLIVSLLLAVVLGYLFYYCHSRKSLCGHPLPSPLCPHQRSCSASWEKDLQACTSGKLDSRERASAA